ncbi:YoaK family protein [Pedobacter sp.]|uniref:YoaK family protein n=1 Tax=Pedobacter sp. TaxID=1411316 RepID=UPI0031DCECC4
MEEKQNNVWFVTLVLTLIAGYCDSITFVAADKIFSAHVTGNFIVFAYQLIKGGGADAWIKLLTFPVFMLSVMVGGWIAARFSNKHFLLLIEGFVLLIAGALAYGFGYINNTEITWPMYVVVMITVFAMGFQNAYGKLFAKDTFGPTTMMTGNVTQFALDIRSYCNSGFKNADFLSGIYKGLVTLGGFLLGCIMGACIGKLLGLAGMVLPGIAMAICYFATDKSKA